MEDTSGSYSNTGLAHYSSNISSENADPPSQHIRRSLKSVLLDIQKTKKKRAKAKQVEAERAQVCLDHLKDGIENTNYKLPFEAGCTFRTANVGLEGLEAEYNTIMSLKDSEESPKTETASMILTTLANQVKEGPQRVDSVFQSVKIGLDGSMKYSRHSFYNPRQSDNDVPKRVTCLKHNPPLGRPILRFETPDHILSRVQIQRETIPWFHDRVDVSSLPVRFGLPMDVTDLKAMNIRTYLNKFCKISHDRMLVYSRFFKQHKPPKAKLMARSELTRAIHAVLYDCVPEEAVGQFVTAMNMVPESESFVDLNTFSLMAAVAERVLYLSFAETAGPVSSGVIRSFTECADFNCLLWKLRDIKIQPTLQMLLYSLG